MAHASLTARIVEALPDGRIIVVCGRTDDARAWRDLLGPARCLALPLDDAPPEARTRPLRGASDHLAWQHHALAGLDGSGWLARPADAFDPNHSGTLVLPDPLDPPRAGTRHRLGPRHPAWRLCEDKTVVDTLWDTIGTPRAPSIITDGVADLGALGVHVASGSGVVCSCQPIGAGPAAGGDGIWWWRDEPPAGIPAGEPAWRVRLMPLLEGVPVRLHGFALGQTVVPFPPMELVTLPRITDGTFLCAGAVASLGSAANLLAQTERLGEGLRERLGYRGGFSVDGILTADGFMPTDFNARLTSAMEAAPPQLRVQLHAANLLARHGSEPAPTIVEALADEIFTAQAIQTLYGSAGRVRDGAPRQLPVRWNGTHLVAADGSPADGQLRISPSPRGWLLTARLIAARLPTRGRLGPLAPEVFRLSDQVLGTDFGDLAPPFGTRPAIRPPRQRTGQDAENSAEAVQRGP